MRVRHCCCVLLLLASSGCNWISLAVNALGYGTLSRGQAGNVVASDSLAYVTLAEAGFAVIDTRSGATVATISPPAGSESVDDIAAAGTLLFALDARAPGHVSVFSLADPRRPRLISPPRAVPVGPFSGISASAGLCIVSGGTSSLSAWRYDSAGALTGPVARADLGRGQPDVLVERAGQLVFVSTHYHGPYFGLDVARVDGAAGAVSTIAELALDGAGFTDGGAKPANFPIEAAQLDDTTLLVAFARGIAVIDVKDASAPRLDRVIDVGGPAVNVDARHGVAAVAVAGAAPAVALLDFSGRAPVVRRITIAPGTIPIGVALTERNIVVAARDKGVLLLER